MCNIHKLEGFNKRMGNLIKKACCSQFLNAYATWTCRSMEFGMHLIFFFFFWIWISKKDVYRKGYLMQNDHKAVQKITRKRRKNK